MTATNHPLAGSGLQSMTAYGYGEFADGNAVYTCEIRTLNSRFLEVNVRLPRNLLALEVDIIQQVKSQLRRGKADVFIELKSATSSKDLPQLDKQALAHYLQLTQALQQEFSQVFHQELVLPSAPEWLQMEGVLQGGLQSGANALSARGQTAAETHRHALFTALDQAVKAVRCARFKEGETLGQAMLDLSKQLELGRQAVAAKRDTILPNLYKNYVKRLENLVATLEKTGQNVGSGFSEDRLLAEAATMVDKADIDEELTRLKTHIDEFARVMRHEEAAGRKLDFLCQEMHREVNTMSNKLLQTDVAQITLEMKQNVERIRQQVQNIE